MINASKAITTSVVTELNDSVLKMTDKANERASAEDIP